MALSHVSSHKPAIHHPRHGGTLTLALVALAVALVIVGNITVAGPAVYRPLSMFAPAH